MPVNLNQHRAAIGVFNNCVFMTSKKLYYFPETSNMKNNFLFTTTINVTVLVFLCFMFRAFFNQKNWKNRFRPTALTFLFFTFFVYHHPWLFIRLIKISGDVEENPGPKRYSAQYLTICCWNLNNIAAHNFIKVAPLKAYTSPSIKWKSCLSETYLDSSVPVDDDNLQISGYSSLRADHPSNTRRGRVLIYYKNFLPIKLIDVKYLHESLNFELRIGRKFVSFYLL